MATVLPASPFDPSNDAQILKKAMKGLGTDEKAIIDLLTARSCEQRQHIKLQYKTMFGKDLVADLKSELSGNFEKVILALMTPLPEYDAESLHKAMKGAGTDEDTLIEIMCSRTNHQINFIKAAYTAKYKKSLEDSLKSETSGYFSRLMISLSTANRNEDPTVDKDKAKRDAKALYDAGEKILGTNESKFVEVLCSQSYAQAREVIEQYMMVASKPLSHAIKSEMSGNLEKGLLAIIDVTMSPAYFFAGQLHKAMKGAGTSDDKLIRLVVTRCEIDMAHIKHEFERQFNKSLASFIKDDTSGDYKKVLLALIK